MNSRHRRLPVVASLIAAVSLMTAWADALPAAIGINPGRVDPRVYRGRNATALIGASHTIQLFVGERRGGPACTAGTCHEVAPFKGAELWLTSRL